MIKYPIENKLNDNIVLKHTKFSYILLLTSILVFTALNVFTNISIIFLLVFIAPPLSYFVLVNHLFKDNSENTIFAITIIPAILTFFYFFSTVVLVGEDDLLPLTELIYSISIMLGITFLYFVLYKLFSVQIDEFTTHYKNYNWYSLINEDSSTNLDKLTTNKKFFTPQLEELKDKEVTDIKELQLYERLFNKLIPYAVKTLDLYNKIDENDKELLLEGEKTLSLINDEIVKELKNIEEVETSKNNYNNKKEVIGRFFDFVSEEIEK